MKNKLLIALAISVLVPFGLASCGGDDEGSSSEAEATSDESSSTGGGGTIAITAVPDGSFAYEEESAEAEAGENTIEFENPASLPHDVQIEGPDGDLGGTETISEDSATFTVDLEPGDYTFYCSVTGHREGGMEGDLTVE